jgi:signal transduction histidine kinase
LRFALIIAIGFTLLTFAISASHPSWRTADGWLRAAGTSLAFALSITITINRLYALFHRLLGARYGQLMPWQRLLFHWGTPVVGLAIALPIASLTLARDPATASGPHLQTTPWGAAAFMLLVMALFYGFFAIRARQLRAERQAADAQLRLLQAQMEPHFLFNTLANVVSLMDTDTPRAKAMLESFTDYLRASLVSLRAPEHALGDELDLVDAYLRVVKVRMDDRLSYRIDVPTVLRAQRVLALSLQPLVENAVVHGLEPSIAGGEIVVTAQLEHARLVIRVADDGVGLDAASASASASSRRGSGHALSNLRERLRQTHAEHAGLTLTGAVPHGLLATLTLPLGGPR